MTRNVGHASARPQAIRSAPPITTRQTYPDGAERARAMPEPGDPGGYPAHGAAPGDALAIRDDPHHERVDVARTTARGGQTKLSRPFSAASRA